MKKTNATTETKTNVASSKLKRKGYDGRGGKVKVNGKEKLTSPLFKSSLIQFSTFSSLFYLFVVHDLYLHRTSSS